MNIRKDMEKTLLPTLSDPLPKKNEAAPFMPGADAAFRLDAQEAALKELQCTSPELGKWVNDCDFPFLIETLALDDAVFSAEFPGVRATAAERKGLANALEEHCESCARCHLKRAYDLEWQSRVRRAFAENKQGVGQAIARAVGKK